MLPRDSDGIKSFQNTRTAFLPFLLHPGAGENSWMCSPRPGSGEKPKMDPGIQHGSSFQHSRLIPTFPGSNSFQREENTERWLLPGIRELLVPSLAKPGEDFPGERLQFSWDNPPFLRENIPGAPLNPSIALGFMQRILGSQRC